MHQSLPQSGRVQEESRKSRDESTEVNEISNDLSGKVSPEPADDELEDKSNAKSKDINLALQGGGSHGAFGWGVLDYLLEDGRLTFEGLSATSAGAVNAVVCASGLLKGGREGGRQALADFWKAVADAGGAYRASLNWFEVASNAMRLQQTQLQSLFEVRNKIASAYSANMMELNPFSHFYPARSAAKPEPLWRNFSRGIARAASAIFSPYYFNPANLNPLKDLLDAHVDFAALRADRSGLKLHLCATNVETGKIRIFKNAELTADTVLASTCMPFLFQAVEIEGAYYWDGGYIGNPAIFPLIYETQCCDVIIVHIDPIVRKGCPKTTLEIMNRHNEISFNSSLMREMRAIAFINQLMDSGELKASKMKRMRMHAIRADAAMSALGALTKTETDWKFLHQLFLSGRETAAEWLDRNYERIGQESTLSFEADYL
jgi:NTE family protein